MRAGTPTLNKLRMSFWIAESVKMYYYSWKNNRTTSSTIWNKVRVRVIDGQEGHLTAEDFHLKRKPAEEWSVGAMTGY
jgi:hypothetical protein